MRVLRLSVLVFCGFFTLAWLEMAVPAQGGSVGPQKRETGIPQRPKLSIKIVNQYYCTKAVEKSRSIKTKLKLSYTLTNESNEALIVHKYGGAGVYGVHVSKSLTNARAKQYVYDPHFSFVRSSDPAFDHHYPQPAPNEHFVVLKPNESWEYEYQTETSITVADTSEPSQNLRPGKYFLQVTMRTWAWPERAAELRQRWIKYGYFWYEYVTSEPMSITIERPSSITTTCEF